MTSTAPLKRLQFTNRPPPKNLPTNPITNPNQSLHTHPRLLLTNQSLHTHPRLLLTSPNPHITATNLHITATNLHIAAAAAVKKSRYFKNL